MASHGRPSVARLVLGSEATRVSTRNTVPVMICQ
jgi:nucleotide-binding universal stress UspA family protein